MRGLALVLLTAVAAATESWTYRPLVTYEDESLIASVPAAGLSGWRLEGAEGTCTIADGQVRIEVVAQGHQYVHLRAGDDPGVGLRFVRPGQAQGLSVGADGLLLMEDIPAVLVLSRLEAREDRRWSLLRGASTAQPVPCAVHLPPPEVPQGQPVLLAQCAGSQALDPRGGVLLELSGLDRIAGWKHREYRQVLAWLVCDLQARAAGHVALAGPFAVEIHHRDLAPLVAQVSDVANAYRCHRVDSAELADPRYWELQPGLLGTSLNDSGRSARTALFAAWIGVTER